MLILLNENHTPEQKERICEFIHQKGFKSHVIPGENSTAIGITGNISAIDPDYFDGLEGIKECIAVTKPYKLSGRSFSPQDTIIRVGDVEFGGNNFVIMAGPCAVESEEQTVRIAKAVKEKGANVLRGGAYKPRTSPYSFHGLGLEGLKILKTASQETGLPIITEALDLQSLEYVNEYADIIQLGTRNMQNFKLLEEVSKTKKPVLLKRGFSSTIEEWLSAAEYLMQNENKQIMLCERGLRSFDKNTRNLLDLSAVPVVKNLSHLPVVVDPSHGTGKKELIIPMSLAALAAGSHAILLDVHDRPHEALCDGPQALLPDEFGQLVQSLHKVAKALDIVVKS